MSVTLCLVATDSKPEEKPERGKSASDGGVCITQEAGFKISKSDTGLYQTCSRSDSRKKDEKADV